MAAVDFWFGETLEDALAPVTIHADADLLPSTLVATDRICSVLTNARRGKGQMTTVVPPQGIAPAVADMLTRHAWQSVSLPVPDFPSSKIRMHRTVVNARSVAIVTDVDAVRGKGPFVLDLVARYVHPLDRVRLIASKRRDDAAAELSLVLTDKDVQCVVVTRVASGFLVAMTVDLIAAELVALGLADLGLPAGEATTGPWEERTVQRATELEMGARLPSDIVPVIHSNLPASVAGPFGQVMSNIGVAMP